MNIIGITGTLGAGKGTIVDYLTKNFGYIHFSVRNYLIEVIKGKGGEPNRDSFVTTANELREKNGASFIIDELYNKALKTNSNCIIESIRTVGEIESLRKKGNFILFAVDADIKLRYSRITERASETDKINLETFIENENREMHSTDPNMQNLSACMSLADFSFLNNGKVDELYLNVDNVMKFLNNHKQNEPK
ncbi:MAG: AAA family ATPase [Bacteroidetes bacterium]|nr:AAA family ATPase [Bacteroidota bacterium]